MLRARIGNPRNPPKDAVLLHSEGCGPSKKGLEELLWRRGLPRRFSSLGHKGADACFHHMLFMMEEYQMQLIRPLQKAPMQVKVEEILSNLNA